jgi:hypothetical protein
MSVGDRNATPALLPRVTDPPVDGTGCRSCEGRGWRYVSPRGLIRVAEDVVPLSRRLCSDCLGRPVSKRSA